MKINGVATLHAPADRVWAVLTDPAVLVATIPGCERLEAAGPDSYRFTVAAGVAAIQGIYTGEVSVSQQREPSSFVLTATGAGGPGTVSTSVQVRLAGTAAGATELSYDADAVIGGMIAGVGQRMLSSIARRTAAEFFSSVDDVLAAAGVASQAAPRAEPDPGLASTVPASTVPASTVPASTVPASTVPASTVPASTVPASTGPASTVPVPAAPQPAAFIAPGRRAGSSVLPPNVGFAHGVLVGAAIALTGMAVSRLIGRRAH
jgi:uncharacterized protein